MTQHAITFDYNLRLKDAGLVAASAAAQVGGANKILDLGAGRVDGIVFIDVSALEVDSGNEVYGIEAQFSSDSAFGSGVVVGAQLRIGDSSVAFGTADNVVGRYELPVCNEFPSVGPLRYMRLYTRVAGTIATGINYSANLVKRSM